MRPEENPLDLNNLPDEYSRDGKQVLEDHSSSPGCRKKKSGGGKEECGKVYECRFCSLKFCKSQALGGHMNRHRQERETETLNHARQLVFRNDHNLVAAQPPPPHPHLGCCQLPIGAVGVGVGAGGYHHHPSGGGDPLSLRFPRYFSAASSSAHNIQPPPPPPPSQSYLYGGSASSASRAAAQAQQHEYYVGHVMGSVGGGNNYTCIGAPVKEGSGNEEHMMGAWGRSYVHNNNNNNNNNNNSSSSSIGLDPPSAINRFQDHHGY